MQVDIEFGGFYHSVHTDQIDQRIDLMRYDFEKVNYKKTFLNYAKAYVDRLNNLLDLELVFAFLDSPKYYNYRTDRIVVGVAADDVETLEKIILTEEFIAWADPQLQSRDGFASFYDGVTDLILRAMHDERDQVILMGMVLSYLVVEEEINEDIYDLEYEIEIND